MARRTIRRPPAQGVKEGTALTPSAAIRERYGRELRKLVRRMAREARREVEAVFESRAAEESAALDASLGSQARIAVNSLARRLNALFRRQSDQLAERMVAQVERDSRAKFGRSLRELAGDTTLPANVLRAGGLDDVVKASVAENVQLIRSISQQYLLDVQGLVMRSIQSGRGMADIVPGLRRIEGVTRRRADTIARDQVSKATAAINRTRAQAAGIRKFKWRHSGGGRDPRPLHQEMDGNIYSYDDPPVIDERTGERGLPGEAINCLPAGLEVNVVHGARKLFRRSFSGELTRLVTETGVALEVTPNHPVLTGRGWVPARLVECGDHVFQAGLQGALGLKTNVEDGKAVVDELFDAALARFGARVLDGGSPLLQFHGDRTDGEVHVVDIDACLPFEWDAAVGQRLVEQLLSLSDAVGDADLLRVDGSGDQLILRALGAPERVLRRLGSLLAKLGAEARGAYESRFAATANVTALLQQVAADRGPAALEAARQFQLTHAGRVERGDLLARQILAVCARHFDPWDLEAASAERLGEIVGVDPELAGDGGQVQAGLEKPLRVVEKGGREYSGHVYNLETARNWYAGAGIVTHNCRCFAVPVIDFSDLQGC